MRIWVARRNWVLMVTTSMAAACLPPAASGQARYDLAIAATTDVHGRLRGWDYYANAADPTRSLAAAATIVDSVRRANPGRVVLLDAGDLLQGNPLLFVAAKLRPTPVHPTMAAMNVMEYDAAVVGNHEFNYGVPLLKRALAQASFPFLAANVHDASGVPFVAPYTVLTRNLPHGAKVRIGVIGATTPGSMVWDADNLRAAGLTVSDIIPAVRNAVAAVRKQKADVIVTVLHSGLNEPATYDTVATGLPSENVAARVAQEIPGIDLVIYGHSHRELVDSTVNGVLLVQPRNWAASVAVATLTIERTKDRWHVVSRRGQSVRTAGHAEDPRVLSASAGTHKAALEWSNASVGKTIAAWRSDSVRVSDQPIVDFVAEVMRRATGAQLAATAAFSLDASLEPGAITRAMLSRIYPYDNTLRVVRVSGAQLRAYMEHSARYFRSLDAAGHAPQGGIIDPAIPGFNFDMLSGAEYTIDLTKPVGARITSLTVQGRAVSPSDTFTLALNNYRAGGGGGYTMLAGAPVVKSIDVDIRQLLIEEVERGAAAGKSFDPADYFVSNWRLEPVAARTAAYAEQAQARLSGAHR